jgi:UDP-glucose 4-epimerase
MKYMVTGGAGFIGSHLSEYLLSEGHEVLVLDNLTTGSYENISHIDGNKKLQIIVDTVNDPHIVTECVRQVDGVFHLASAVGVKLILEKAVHTIENIVTGTQVVFGICSKYRKPVLLTSTSEVYGKGFKIPFCEDDDTVMGATSKQRWSYACAKAVDEFLALAYWYESKLPIKIVRLFNTVGPKQVSRYGMVIPRFVQQALGNEPVTVYGSGEQSRCFAHVRDIIPALLKIMMNPKANGQVFNLGNDEEISMLDLAKLVKELCGSKSEIVKIPYEKAYIEGFDDMNRRVPSLEKIKQLINYQPKYSLKDILQDIIAYERSKT